MDDRVSAATSAAFFDLDRTVLGVGSGPMFSRALRELGLGPQSEPAALKPLFSFFDLVGENRATMTVVRQGIRLTKGWDAATFEEAGRLALDELLDAVQPYVPGLLAEHRAKGQALVLATTTPVQLVAPLAAELGFDAVVATRYAVDDEGLLTGSVDGEFVWNRGKLRAVRTWAREHGIDLRASAAYSDSWYDAPLLDAVGHPVAANPDARLAVLARLRDWPIRHLDKPPGIVKLGPFEIQDLLAPFLPTGLGALADFDVVNGGLLPASGPAIVAANHRSYFDPIVIAAAVMSRGRSVRILGKREVFDAPLVGDLASALGGIPVDRGSGSDEPLARAAEALDAGEVVVILPQGTIPRGPEFFDPRLRGRPGVVRLAALTGAPIVPLALWGTEAVWPRSARAPLVPSSGRPTVTATFGHPVETAGDDLAVDTESVMSAIAELLPDAARREIEPSAEELARTYPGGRVPSD